MADQYWWILANVFVVATFCAAATYRKSDDLVPLSITVLLGTSVFLVSSYLFSANLEKAGKNVLHENLLAYVGVIILCFAIYISVNFLIIFLRGSKNPFMILGTRMGVSNKQTKVIFSFWGLTFYITLALATSLELDNTFIDESFFYSWLANFVFYSCLGIVISLMNIQSVASSDSFENRFSKFFKTENDKIQNSLKDEVVKLGVISKQVTRMIEVEEYSDTYKAYKVRVINTTILKNLFDDVVVTDNIKFGIIPDKFDLPSQTKPTILGQIMSIKSSHDNKNFLSKPIIIAENSEPINEKLAIGEEDLTVEVVYWIWMSIDEEIAMNAARFTENVTSTIVNRISSGNTTLRFDQTVNKRTSTKKLE